MGFFSWLAGNDEDEPTNLAVEPGTIERMEEVDQWMDKHNDRDWTREEMQELYDMNRPLSRQGIHYGFDGDESPYWRQDDSFRDYEEPRGFWSKLFGS